MFEVIYGGRANTPKRVSYKCYTQNDSPSFFFVRLCTFFLPGDVENLKLLLKNVA